MIFICFCLFSLLQSSYTDEIIKNHNPSLYPSSHQYQSFSLSKTSLIKPEDNNNDHDLLLQNNKQINQFSNNFLENKYVNLSKKDDLSDPLIQSITPLLNSLEDDSTSSNTSSIFQSFNIYNETESRRISSWLGKIKKKLSRTKEPKKVKKKPSKKSKILSNDTKIPLEFMFPKIHNNLPLMMPILTPFSGGFPSSSNVESPPNPMLPANHGFKFWIDFLDKTNHEEMPYIFDLINANNEGRFYKKQKKIPKVGKNNFYINKLTSYEELSEGDADTDDSTSPRCDKFTSHICIDSFDYPEQAIMNEIYKKQDLFERMYSEVKGHVPLVDGISREEEEYYNYFSEQDDEENENISTSPNNLEEYMSSEQTKHKASGFVCLSEILYGKPKLAQNIKGDWKIIVNVADYTQTVRMQKCLKPNKKCNYINDLTVNTRCAQINSLHRLMVFEKGKGFYIDTFRIPTACSCHLSKSNEYTFLKNFKLKKRKSILSKKLPLHSLLKGMSALDYIDSVQENDRIEEQLELIRQMKDDPLMLSSIFRKIISDDELYNSLSNLKGPASNSVPIQEKYSTNEMNYLFPIYTDDPTNLKTDPQSFSAMANENPHSKAVPLSINLFYLLNNLQNKELQNSGDLRENLEMFASEPKPSAYSFGRLNKTKSNNNNNKHFKLITFSESSNYRENSNNTNEKSSHELPEENDSRFDQ